MSEVVIIYGLSGSGKSTKAIEEYPFHVRLERDIIRRSVNAGFAEGGWEFGFPSRMEPLVTAKWYHRLINAIENKEDIVISDTLLTLRRRRELSNILEFYGCAATWIRMDTPLSECIKRDKYRGVWSVGEEVILTQFNKLHSNKEHV